ncbi:hypothetical protein BC829DRAFT_396776, partial [Chytridium lagenaria]
MNLNSASCFLMHDCHSSYPPSPRPPFQWRRWVLPPPPPQQEQQPLVPPQPRSQQPPPPSPPSPPPPPLFAPAAKSPLQVPHLPKTPAHPPTTQGTDPHETDPRGTGLRKRRETFWVRCRGLGGIRLLERDGRILWVELCRSGGVRCHWVGRRGGRGVFGGRPRFFVGASWEVGRVLGWDDVDVDDD